MAEQKKIILLVEDDPGITLGLTDSLMFEGFEVIHTDVGRTGIDIVRKQNVDCLILDLMLPDISGFEVCKEVRRINAKLPILMLTARSQDLDKVRGFDAGADDYVTKPFSVVELLARIRAMFRRTERNQGSPSPVLQIGTVTIDLNAQVLKRQRETWQLTFYEVEVIRFLYERLGQTVPRDDILDRVWGMHGNTTNRSVDNVIVKLRRKIEKNPEEPRHILTVYGQGYKLVTSI